MSIMRDRLFLSASIGHMILDIFNSSISVLVAFLSLSMGLNNAMVALALGLYQFAGAFSQPIFGYLGDRYGGPRMMGFSVAWTIGLLVSAIFAAQTGVFWLFLIPFTLASLGSGAFHPVGTKYAALTATRRAATATALFFLFGQLGLATGPLLAGFMLDYVGLMGMPMVAILTIPVILFVITTPMPAEAKPTPATPTPPTSVQEAGGTRTRWIDRIAWVRRIPAVHHIPWGSISILIAHTICRSWAQIGIVSFVPKLFQDKGWSPTSYGGIVTVMWIASAITGVLAGDAADRWGRRQVIFVVMMLSVIPLYYLPLTESWVAYPLALLVGGLTGAPHSITVVIAQSMLPGKQATASGLILGLIFGMGAFATFGIGWLADRWTLEQALQVGALMALLAAVTALALPSTRRQPEAELESEKVTV